MNPGARIGRYKVLTKRCNKICLASHYVPASHERVRSLCYYAALGDNIAVGSFPGSRRERGAQDIAPMYIDNDYVRAVRGTCSPPRYSSCRVSGGTRVIDDSERTPPEYLARMRGGRVTGQRGEILDHHGQRLDTSMKAEN